MQLYLYCVMLQAYCYKYFIMVTSLWPEIGESSIVYHQKIEMNYPFISRAKKIHHRKCQLLHKNVTFNVRNPRTNPDHFTKFDGSNSVMRKLLRGNFWRPQMFTCISVFTLLRWNFMHIYYMREKNFALKCGEEHHKCIKFHERSLQIKK